MVHNLTAKAYSAVMGGVTPQYIITQLFRHIYIYISMYLLNISSRCALGKYISTNTDVRCEVGSPIWFRRVPPVTLYHRDDALLYIAYVMLIWAAPIPADRWHCSLWLYLTPWVDWHAP